MSLHADGAPSRRWSPAVPLALAGAAAVLAADAAWGRRGCLAATAALALAGAAAWLVRRALRRAADRAAARARRDFLDGMSHELRTPLNGVIGFSSVLLRTEGGRLTPDGRRYLERVRANGELLLGVVEELLAQAERPRGDS